MHVTLYPTKYRFALVVYHTLHIFSVSHASGAYSIVSAPNLDLYSTIFSVLAAQFVQL